MLFLFRSLTDIIRGLGCRQKKEAAIITIEYQLAKDIKTQIEHFLSGFHDLIPKHLISIFDERELELLISGLPDIDSKPICHTTITSPSPRLEGQCRI